MQVDIKFVSLAQKNKNVRARTGKRKGREEMKSKKLISLLCAAALSASSFASLTISAGAAAGDILHTSTFEDAAVKTTEKYKAPVMGDDGKATTKDVDCVTDWDGNNWGALKGQSAVYYGSATDAREYMSNVIGSQKVDDTTVWTDTFKPTTVTPPAVTGTKSLYFATQIGMNPSGLKLTVAPAIGASASGVYGLNFDMMLVNGDHEKMFNNNKLDRTYTVTIGGLKLSVTNENLSYYDGSTAIDTGVDLTLAGTWFNFDLVYDATNKQFKGTITPYNGDDLVEASKVTIPWAKFNGTATTITEVAFASERTDGANKGAVNCAIDNFTVKEAAAVTYEDVKINLKSGDTILKTETVKAETGTTLTASDSYKVSFATEASRAAEKYYVYDNASTDSVTVAAGAEINLNFTETSMPTVTINAVTGDSKTLVGKIGEGKAVPGESVTVWAHEYMQDAEGKWYQKNDGRTGGRGDMYEIAVTAGTEDVVEKVNYKPAYNVVSFVEAEDSENVVDSDDGLAGGSYNSDYTRQYASGGVWAQSQTPNNYPLGFYTTPVAKAGTYEVTVRTRTIKRPAAVAKVTPGENDAVTMEKVGETKGDAGITTDTFTAELEAGEYFWVGKSGTIGTEEASSTKLINDVDYIVVKDVNVDAEPAAAVTLTYSKDGRKASLTHDQDRTVDAVLIHASYNADGTINTVKAYPASITSGATATAVAMADDDAVKAGDKLMVWDGLKGMKPLLATPHVITAEEADAIIPQKTAIGGTVTISGTTEVGSTLTAVVTAVTPAEAQAGLTYKWQKQGTEQDSWSDLAATTSTYVPDEAGTFRVVVTAAADSNYTGSVASAPVTVTAPQTPATPLTGVTLDKTTGVKVGDTLTATVAPADATVTYAWYTVDGTTETVIADESNNTLTVTAAMLDKKIKVVATGTGDYEGTVNATTTDAVTADAPTVGTAQLEDHSENPIAAADLASNYSATLAQDGTTINIAATDLKSHENGVNVEGFWAGATVTAPAGQTIEKYYFGQTPYVAGTSALTATGADDKQTIEFYVNVGATDQKRYAAVELSNGVVFAYTLDTTAVTRAYKINITTPENGTVSFKVNGEDATTAKVGDTVTVTAVPADGYSVTAVTVTPAELNQAVIVTPGANNTYTFTMPASAVTVTVKAVPLAPIADPTALGTVNGTNFPELYAAADIVPTIDAATGTVTVVAPAQLDMEKVPEVLHGGSNAANSIKVGVAITIPQGAVKLSFDDDTRIEQILDNPTVFDIVDGKLLDWFTIATKDGVVTPRIQNQVINWYDENNEVIAKSTSVYVVAPKSAATVGNIGNDLNGTDYPAAVTAAGIDIVTDAGTVGIAAPATIPTEGTGVLHGGNNVENPYYVPATVAVPTGAADFSIKYTITKTDGQPVESTETLAGTYEGKTLADLCDANGNYVEWVPVATKEGATEAKTLTAVYTWKNSDGNVIGVNTLTATVSVKKDTTPATIDVTPKAVPALQGETKTFSAIVKDGDGDVTSQNGVTWSVSGNTSQKTTISDAGVLTIGSDETGTLTVTATSTVATSVSGSTTVTVATGYVEKTLTVVRPDGTTAIEGATVTAAEKTVVGGTGFDPILFAIVGTAVTTGTTDASGNVTLALDPNKEYTVTVAKGGATLYTGDLAEATTKITVPAAATTVPEAENGNSVTLAPANAIAGDTVTITPTVGTDYVFTGVTVKAKDTAETPVQATKQENGTYTFTMPAEGVTVTPAFAKLYSVTVATATNGTVEVKNEAGDAALASTVVAGTKFTVATTPADTYEVDTVTVSYNDGEAKTLTADNGVYTMPAYDVTVTVTFKLAPVPVVTYDFEDGTAGFVKTARVDPSVVDAPAGAPAQNGTKVLQFASGGTNGNNAVVRLDFSAAVQNATSADIEFDSYLAKNSRVNFVIYDSSKRGNATNTTNITKGSVNNTGALFRQGENSKDASGNGQYSVNSATLEATNAETLKYYENWVHTKVSFNYVAKTFDYTISSADGTVLENATGVSYSDTSASYATGIEIVSWVANTTAYMDNIKVYAEIGTSNTVTINYVDTEDNVIKTAETDATAINTLSYTVDAAKKATFEAEKDGVKYRYTYTSEGSTDTIAAVSDDAKTITLKFTKEAYTATPFKVTLPAAAGEGGVTVPVKVTGTPTDTTAAPVDTTVNVAVEAGATEGTASIALLPGTYNYSIVATDAYTAVDSTAVTVGRENAITLEANTAEKATLTVVYTTDGSETGKVSEVTVYGESDGKFVGDVIEPSEFTTYAENVTVNNDDESGTFKVYKYVSGAPAENVTLSNASNKVYMTVETDNKDYYFYQDFENSGIDVSKMFTGAADSTTKKIITGTDNNKLFSYSSSKTNGARPDNMAIDVTNTTTKYKVSFDWQPGVTQRGTGWEYVSVSDKRDGITVTDGKGDLTTNPYAILGLVANGYANNDSNTKATIYWYTGSNIGSYWHTDKNCPIAATENVLFTGIAQGTMFHVEAEIDYTTKKIALSITNKSDNATVTKTLDIVDATSNIGYMSVGCGRSDKGNTGVDNVYLDNITVEPGSGVEATSTSTNLGDGGSEITD